MKSNEVITGLQTVDQVIAMNTRLREIMQDGINIDTDIDGLERQIVFLADCLEADRESIITIHWDDIGSIHSMIRVLREEIAKKESCLQEQEGCEYAKQGFCTLAEVSNNCALNTHRVLTFNPLKNE